MIVFLYIFKNTVEKIAGCLKNSTLLWLAFCRKIAKFDMVNLEFLAFRWYYVVCRFPYFAQMAPKRRKEGIREQTHRLFTGVSCAEKCCAA